MNVGADHECSVCLAPFVDPIDLACGHTFCRYCLIKSTRLAPDGRSCPLCRSLINIRSVMEHPVSEARVLAVRQLLGDEVYDERLAQRALELAELNKLADLHLPIFFMFPGTRVGGRVALHLFEPRYKILIRRAFEGNRLFVYCPCLPQRGAPGVIVRIADAIFLADGRANILGLGVEEVSLGDTWIEDGTGGLYHTSVASVAAGTVRDGEGVESRGLARSERANSSGSEGDQHHSLAARCDFCVLQ